MSHRVTLSSSSDDGHTVAPELGHILLGSDHHGDSDNLMVAGALGRELRPEQCAAAQEAASFYNERLHAFYVARGLADPVALLPPGSFLRGPALSPGTLYSTGCCNLGTRKIRTLDAVCIGLGGTRTTNCDVCCRRPRNCPGDACCVRSTDEYASVDLSECEAEDVAPAAACDCCAFTDGGTCAEVQLPSEDCVAQGGMSCPAPDPT
jgi:hypothetical protein